MRIGIVLDHPSPHTAALLDALSAREDCSAYVIYLDRSAPRRKWGAPAAELPHQFARGFDWPGGVRMNPAIIRMLKSTQVDVWVLFTCYNSPTTLLAAWWLDRAGVPWVYVNEPPQPRGLVLETLKRPMLSFVLKRAWGILGTGGRAREMYRDIVAADKPTESVPYYIPLDTFYSLPPGAALAHCEPVQFVTSCQMIKRKGLDILLRACELLPNDGWALTLVGDGPLRAKLERDFACHWDQSRVRFIGQVPYEARASLFAGKHVFVFSSRWDGWGMVVPEALAAGLPVISSDAVMSAHEFIRNGDNGFVSPSGDAQSLARHMRFFIENRTAIPSMGLAARRSVESYRPDIGAEKLVTFLQSLKNVNLTVTRIDPVGPAHGAEPNTWKRLTSPSSPTRRLRLTTRRIAKSTIIRTALAVRPRKRPHSNRILVYHLVLPEDRKRFEEHLKFLSEHFDLCTVEELLAQQHVAAPNKRYRAAISFDDGFRILVGDCLELCQKYGIRATYYVPTGFVQLSESPELAAKYSLRAHYYNLPLEPMRKEDLKLLSDLGHEVGSHGYSHTKFSFLSRHVATRELTLSMSHIEKWTGKIPAGFAYPNGDLRSSLGQPSQWVQAAHYRYAVTLKRGPVTERSDPFQLPRDHVEGNWSLKDLQYFLLGR